MATLLVAAFLSINVLSLVYMLFIAIGMALPERSRRLLWRLLVLPALGGLLIWQYAVLIWPPPFLGQEAGKRALLLSMPRLLL